MNQTLRTIEQEANPVIDLDPPPPSSLPMSTTDFLQTDTMDRLIRFAEIMSAGKATVPEHLRGSMGDCLAVTMQAAQWKMNPFAVAQKTHLVHGTLGYEAQLVNAVINTMAPTRDRLHYEWFGPWERVIGKFEIRRGDKGEYRVPGWKLADEEGIGVRVWATLKGEDKPRELELLLAQARTRNSTLWADDPRQQLAYLATKRWARLYTPDVILGVYTPDEFEEPPVRDMGTIQPERKGSPGLPVYPPDQFKANTSSWKTLITSGKKTPADIINMIGSKYLLSDDQKKAIKALASKQESSEQDVTNQENTENEVNNE